MTVPEDRTTDSAEGAADQPSLARPVEEIRADLARAASPYYCGGGPVADRLATDAASLLSRLAAVEREAAEAKACIEAVKTLCREAESSSIGWVPENLPEVAPLTMVKTGELRAALASPLPPEDTTNPASE